MTPTSLQKIVDGEMSQEMLAIALQELDRDQANWRGLALALLEEQQWAKQIAQMKSSRQDRFTQLVSIASSEPTVVASKTSNIPQRVFTQTSKKGFGAGSAFLGTLAASLILGIGFAGGMFLTDTSTSPTVDQQSLAGVAPKQTSGLASPKSIEALNAGMKMVVTGPDSEKSEIPIYDLGEVDPTVMWAKEEYELARLKEQLRRKGYQLEVRPEYYTSTLNDGRQLIVPVKNVDLKPFGL